MIFRELIQGSFGILMFQKCQVCIILTFKAFPIKSICFTIQGLNTHKHPLDASKHHKHTYTPLLCSQKPTPVISGQFSTTTNTNRHQATPTDVPRHPKRLFGDVGLFRFTSKGVLCFLLVSDGVCQCLMLSGGSGCGEGLRSF